MGITTDARWEHFHHEADIGVRGIGRTKAEAFEQAATAITAVICRPGSVLAKEMVGLGVAAADDDLLLYDWLNELIYEMSTRRMLFSRFQVEIGGFELDGRIWGERIDPERHQPAVEVKGATFTELAVRQHRDGHWSAQCVVDV